MVVGQLLVVIVVIRLSFLLDFVDRRLWLCFNSLSGDFLRGSLGLLNQLSRCLSYLLNGLDLLRKCSGLDLSWRRSHRLNHLLLLTSQLFEILQLFGTKVELRRSGDRRRHRCSNHLRHRDGRLGLNLLQSRSKLSKLRCSRRISKDALHVVLQQLE